MTDVDICSHSREGKTPSYSQINMVVVLVYRKEKDSSDQEFIKTNPTPAIKTKSETSTHSD